MNKIKIAIAGSSGRMGRILLENVFQSDDLVLHAALEHGSSALLGKDAGEMFGALCGIKVSADVATALKGADVLIDFTRPEGTAASPRYLPGTRCEHGDRHHRIQRAATRPNSVLPPNTSASCSRPT